ncbi:MAG: HAD family hydrolase [Actinobacteria bacterium]|nr:HAD family hydrolase [Actinomycetota bacterium]
MAKPAAILDIDGTLVDTNYHHALAWFRAFRQSGVVLPIWRIHRHIGMGGDQLIPSLAGEKVSEELGDAIEAAQKVLYIALIDEVQPMKGSRELIDDLRERGHSVILASSGRSKEVDHYLELLDARDRVDGWTTSEDVEDAKPEPDLVVAALEKSDSEDAVMIGDSVYDVAAATKAGVMTITLLTGGYSATELTEAGAVAVFESIEELRAELDDTPLS